MEYRILTAYSLFMTYKSLNKSEVIVRQAAKLSILEIFFTKRRRVS